MTTVESALQRFLSRLLIRSALTANEQQAILRLSGPVSNFRPRVDIVVPGQRVDHACLVAGGIAARFDQMRNGQRQLTAFYVPGDMCDLHSIVAPTAAWGISAISTTTIVQVPHTQLCKVVSEHPNLALAFWRDGMADASILAKWVGNLGRRDALARLAHIFCEFGIRMELAGLGTRTAFDLAVSQEQLADAVGLTAVHVNRTLQRLRSDGLLKAQSGRIEIDDWNRLAAAAEFDPIYLLLERERLNAGTDGSMSRHREPVA